MTQKPTHEALPVGEIFQRLTGKPFGMVLFIVIGILGCAAFYLLSMGPFSRYVVSAAADGKLEKFSDRRIAYQQTYAPVLRVRQFSGILNRLFNAYERLWLSSGVTNRVEAAWPLDAGTQIRKWVEETPLIPTEDRIDGIYNLTRFLRARGVNLGKGEYAVYIDGRRQILVAAKWSKLEPMLPFVGFYGTRTTVDVLPKLPSADLSSSIISSEALMDHLENVRVPEISWDNVPLFEIARWVEETASAGRPEKDRVVVILQLRKENSGPDSKTVSLNLKDVPLFDTLRVVCALTGTSFRVEGNDIVIAEQGVK